MKKAPIPKNEESRLQTLLEYQVLDTAPSLEYDDLTLLASSICKTPIALVSLVDESRQWFKSHHGLNAKETPRDISFCGHAICGSEVFVVEDSAKDPRFADNPLAAGAPHVRFYAGAPLIAPNGQAVGTLCVIDHEPRKLDASQLAALQALARQVIGQLELLKSNRNVSQHLKDLQEATKLLEENRAKLAHSAQLASLGEMAAGIAHEINNPLGIIVGKANILMQSMEKGKAITPEKLKEGLSKIVHSSFRVSEIIKSMKSLSRDGRNDPLELIPLSELFQEAVSLYSQKFKENGIALAIDCSQELTASGRRTQLMQIISNLLSNAIDASSKLEKRWVKVVVRKNAGMAEIKVIDSGSGITEELKKKIMQPFFTTKDPGKGTGLGLSISKKLAEAQHGTLKLDNAEKNTCFVVTIPLAEEAAKIAA